MFTRSRLPALPAYALLTALVACGGGSGEPPLVDTAWCAAQAAQADPLPALFSGEAGVADLAVEYVSEERYSSGIAIATVSAAGDHYYTAGATRWDGGVPIGPDTVFEIGSITKVFTGLLLADAVVRGEVALTDPVDDYLPAAGQLPSRGGQPVALWHLATHTAGLPRDLREFGRGPFDPWYATYGTADLYRALSRLDLDATPGTRASYSNLGVALLGHVLSLRTGLSYQELVTARILEPLGMTSTYLYQEPDGVQLATPYDHRDRETDYFMVPAGMEGAGRLRSTARDLVRFARAAVGLDAGSLQPAFQLAEALHFAGVDGAESGLAWGRGHAGGDLFLAHGGATWGFTAALNLDRTRQLGTVILTNSRHDRDCWPAYLAYWLTAWQRAGVVDAATLSAYRGTFPSADGPVRLEVRGERLYVQLAGRPPQLVHPASADGFFSLSQDLELRLVRDDGGAISRVELRTSADPPFSEGARACQGPVPPRRTPVAWSRRAGHPEERRLTAVQDPVDSLEADAVR